LYAQHVNNFTCEHTRAASPRKGIRSESEVISFVLIWF